MKTVGHYIEQYYQDHLGSLRQQYPGLTKKRLLEEYLAFSGLHEHEIFVRPYCTFFEKLEEGVPLEYINQNAFFFEHNFYVDSNVLIPRFETELLVEEAVDFLLRYKQSKSVYEVGVGSGAVILSILAKIDRPLETFASDISEGALEVTRKNYFRLKNCFHPKSKLELKLTDRLTKEINKFDLIISNPPYIKLDKDSAKVHQQVLKFEPECALFLVDDQYNDWFSTLFNQVNSCLNEEGVFLMEGHEDHLGELETIAKNYFAFTKLKKDLSGQLRFLQAAKKEF